MSIKTTESAARDMLKILNAVASNQSIDIRYIDFILTTDEAYKMWVNKLGGEKFHHEYLNVWSSIINDVEYEGKLKGIYTRYKIMLENIDLLNSTFNFAQNLDFSEVEKCVAKNLPLETVIDVTVHFIIDGYNGGTIIDPHNYTQCISTLDKEHFQTFGVYGIGHELHHIGSRYWQNKDPLRTELLKKEDHNSLAVRLVGSILDEGCGVYYFDNQIDQEVTRQVVSRLLGKNQYDAIVSSYKAEKAMVAQRINELTAFLVQLLNGNHDHHDMKNAMNAYFFMQGTKPSLDKLIGEEMVGTINEAFGKDAVMACLVNLKNFLPTYDEAAKHLNKAGLSNELITKWHRLWAS